MGLRHPWQRLDGRRRSLVCTAKNPRTVGLFCGKWPVNIRHATSNNCAYQNFMLCLVPSHESPALSARHDSCRCVTWRWVGDMTHSYAWHGTTRACAWLDSRISAMSETNIFQIRKLLFHSSVHREGMPYTGWRRVIGCFKLQVSFRMRAMNYRALLQKMTCKDKASSASSPPCR